MRGNLSEIDICSVLQLIELGQKTGLLYVEANLADHLPKANMYLHHLRSSGQSAVINPSGNQSWWLFCNRGEIIYACSGDGLSSRLNDYLRHYRIRFPEPGNGSASSALSSHPGSTMPEYENLWMLLRQDIINAHQACTILIAFIQEIIFDILDIVRGQFVFTTGLTLTPKLHGLKITPLIQQSRVQKRSWQMLFPHIQSPLQLPQMRNPERVRACLPPTTVQKLQRWADGKTSLRRLARMLNRDILAVGKAIYPYVQQGFVQLILPQSEPLPSTQVPRLALIGNDLPESLQSLLAAQGYEAIAFSHPFDSLLRLFDIKPNLILLHTRIYDEKIYDLCGMFRHSQTFKFIPVIILSDEDNYINRVRAQIAGATDFLPTPCQDSELLVLIEKILKDSPYNQWHSYSKLVERDKDKVKNVITESISGNKTFVSRNLVNE